MSQLLQIVALTTFFSAVFLSAVYAWKKIWFDKFGGNNIYRLNNDSSWASNKQHDAHGARIWKTSLRADQDIFNIYFDVQQLDSQIWNGILGDELRHWRVPIFALLT